MAGHLEVCSNSHQWNVNFLRATHDSEADSFISLFNLLYYFRLRWVGKNKLYWVPSSRGVFFFFFLNVKYYYNVVIPHVCNALPWKSIWKNKILLRVVFFA
jgi:hypothetical protein